MPFKDFVMNENPVFNSEVSCESISTENISESGGDIMGNSTVSEESSMSNSEILTELLNNESGSESDSKIIVNDCESDENSSCYTDSGISTTSPVVLYLRPNDHINYESSMNVLSKKSDNNERPFSCELCDKTFKRRAHYNVHLYTHNPERQFVCKTCNKAFAHHYFLKNHEYTHNTVKQFTCEFCNEEFSVRRYYTRHIRSHTKRKYECDADACDIVCFRLKESITHTRTHGGNIFSCDKCDRCFCQELSLNLHHCFETDLKRFSCKLCPKTFRKIWDLESHEAVHENKKLMVCDICKKGFNTKYSLKVHIQTTHDEDNPIKPYSCQACEKKFHLEVNLKRHEITHRKRTQAKTLNIEPDPVSEYQSRINQKQSAVGVGYLNIEGPVPLQQLVYFIPGKKINYVCDICLKGFRYRYTLTVHRRRHTGEKPFQCGFCNRPFADKGDLKRHIRVHTGDRKYACDACDRTFTRKAYMRTHFESCIKRTSLPKIESVYSVNENSD